MSSRHGDSIVMGEISINPLDESKPLQAFAPDGVIDHLVEGLHGVNQTTFVKVLKVVADEVEIEFPSLSEKPERGKFVKLSLNRLRQYFLENEMVILANAKITRHDSARVIS